MQQYQFYRDSCGAVYIHYSTEKRRIYFPRSECRHLDNLSDEEIRSHLLELSRQYRMREQLAHLVKEWASYRQRRGRCVRTVRDQISILTRIILPHFKWEPPREWPRTSASLIFHLEETLKSKSRIRFTQHTLLSFWKWLQEERQVDSSLSLLLRPPLRGSQRTPLPSILSPDQLLDWLRNENRGVEVRLLALCGYFFSLRPQETFALKRADFLAGHLAAELECCKEMERAVGFNRLAVRISRQRRMNGQLITPKTEYSAAWVACSHREAALLLLPLLNSLPEESPLFHQKPWGLLSLWKREGLPGYTLKDLRRASLYYLGVTSGMNPVSLKHHARHSSLSTTMLYCRRPEEVIEQNTRMLNLELEEDN